MHFDLDQAVALAFFATPALDVEAESSGVIASNLCGGQLREQIANRIEHTGVGRRVAARGAANRGLVNHDDLVQILDPSDFAMRAGALLGSVQPAEQGPAENVVHQGALAGAAHAGHAG